jgi:vancomycin aglycone glucosyltransferase
MKIVLCGVGSHGDIQPLLGLSRALLPRGHDVVLCAGANYAEAAAGAGLGFCSMGTSIEQLVKEGGEDLFSPLRFIEVARRIAHEQLERTIEAVRGADVVVGGAACFVGPTAARLAGARFCWAALAPGSFPTSTAPFLLSGLGPDHRWLNRLTHTVGIGVLGRILMGVLNPLRRARGLDDVDGYDSYVLADDVVALYAVDPVFGGVPADWGIAAHQTGFWFYDDGRALPDDVEAFLAAGDAPVYVGFGSMPVKDPAARTRTIVEALLRCGRRGIVARGWGGLGDGPLPPSILRVGHVSHARLFPRCAAVVHHCGAGTTSAAARAGVPQIPVPHAWDQPTWRAHLLRLGVAKRALPRGFSNDALAGAIDDTLADDDVKARARALGDVLGANDGAATAADVIEAFAAPVARAA